jgi:hypothetical protein
LEEHEETKSMKDGKGGGGISRAEIDSPRASTDAVLHALLHGLRIFMLFLPAVDDARRSTVSCVARCTARVDAGKQLPR